MFLDIMDSKEGRKISKLARESSTFNAFYMYWRDVLFERVMRLFVWENTGSVQPKEIEQRLLLQGHVGITTLPNETELTAMFGSFYGPTKYLDEFTSYTVRCPIYSGTRTIGKDIAIINNNSLRNSTYDLVHHYAILLAHTEVTLVMALVNVRDNGGIPVAQTEKQKQSILDYEGKIFNGQMGVVADIGSLGVNYAGTNRNTNQDVADIYTTRENILKAFYSDIGVRSAFMKKSNSVEAEVEADTSLLLLNLSDMLKCRQMGAEAVNNLYGTNWSVRITDEINYSNENEVEVDENAVSE